MDRKAAERTEAEKTQRKDAQDEDGNGPERSAAADVFPLPADATDGLQGFLTAYERMLFRDETPSDETVRSAEETEKRLRETLRRIRPLAAGFLLLRSAFSG